MKLSEFDFETVMHSKLFRGTAESVLNKMSAGSDCEMKFYNKGDSIFSTKNFSRSVGIILEGSARVLKENDDGHEFILNTLNVGDVFGAAALFNDEKEYVSKIYAAEYCRAIFFSERLILRGIERDLSLAENYISYLSDRIVFLNRIIHFLISGSAQQRLANFFIENLSEDDFRPLPLNMTQLSSQLNISRASLYRVLDLLINSGAVSRNGKEYKISDISKLRCLS